LKWSPTRAKFYQLITSLSVINRKSRARVIKKNFRLCLYLSLLHLLLLLKSFVALYNDFSFVAP